MWGSLPHPDENPMNDDNQPFYSCCCGYQFPEELGKYGCPNCEGENDAELVEPA